MTAEAGAPDSQAGEPPVALPVALPLAGRVVVVVGGGETAARKLDALVGTGALIHVVAPRLSAATRAHVDASRTTSWRAARFAPDTLVGAALVFAATDIAEVDHAVSVAARAAGIPVNAADRPDDCTFFMTATVRRGPVTIAVSTSGVSPALASYLRRRLEGLVGQSLGELAARVGAARRARRASTGTTVDAPWSSVVDDDLWERAEAQDWAAVDERLAAITVDVR